jgi:uncharacterized membrane protein YgcG
MSKRKRLGQVGLAVASISLPGCDNVPAGIANREVFGGTTAAEARAACVARYGNDTLCEHMSHESAEVTRAAGTAYHRPFYYYGPWYNSSGIIMPGGVYQPMPTRPTTALGVKSFDSITKAPISIAPSHNGPRTAFRSSSGTRSGGFGATGGARGGGGTGGGG